MKLVFDTNVLFAAYISRGACASLYEQALAAEMLLTSEPILVELAEKLIAKGKLEPSRAEQIRAEVAANSIVVEVKPLPVRVCRDPDDDIILATAVSARADLLVTGDNDLLILGSHAGIPIVTPAECLLRMRG